MADKKPILTAPPSLVGQRVYLRPMTAEDAANTHHWFVMSEPQSLSCRPHIVSTASEAAELFKKSEHTVDAERFMIVRKDDNVPVGRVDYFNYNSLNRSAELGLIVDPDERGKGYGLEGFRLLCRYLFQYRGFNKVYAQTADFNKATVKLLESAGFKKDGTLRQHNFYERGWHDALIYSLLAFEADNL
jgi:[ribosomal protein S5]-alanine N-acetyltransferase